MNKNVGSLDKTVRIIAGVVLVAPPFLSGMPVFESGALKVASVAVGVVFIATALINFCPLYRLLNIRT